MNVAKVSSLSMSIRKRGAQNTKYTKMGTQNTEYYNQQNTKIKQQGITVDQLYIRNEKSSAHINIYTSPLSAKQH